MKLPIFAVCVFFAGSLTAQTARILIDPIHSSGAFVSVSAFSNNSDVFLQATRSDNNGATATFMSLDIFTFTATGFSDTFAFGTIPNDGLEGDNTKHLSLNVDTNQLSTFQATTCTFDFATFTDTCQPGPVGVIQLTFDQDGAFTSSVVADTKNTFFQFEEDMHQQSDSASAVASGAVLGIAVNNGFSQIGAHRDTTITFTSTH